MRQNGDLCAPERLTAVCEVFLTMLWQEACFQLPASLQCGVNWLLSLFFIFLDLYAFRFAFSFANGLGLPFPDPHNYRCPITLAVMCDPVFAADGHTYERAAIQQWFKAGHATSPKTNAQLSSMALTPNHQMRSMIRALSPWVRRHI